MIYIKLIILFFVVFLVSCKQTPESTDKGYDSISDKDTAKITNIVSKTFQTETGWGYDVYVDGKHMIHQPHMPCVTGNKGFSSEEKAKKTVDFISEKIRNNIIPPTVTLKELDSLGVL